MIFNTTYRLLEVLPPLSQDEILHTPEYFAMSAADIIRDPGCPAHLKRVLNALPLGERPSVVQVRPQDFRRGVVPILGTGWHVDVNTRLANGRMHLAKDLLEFTSTVVSFGDVAETEFAVGPIEIDTKQVDPFNHGLFAGHVERLAPITVTALPNQVASYTSRDIHRVNPRVRPGNMRLIIVTFECDDAVESDAGRVLPSIHQRSAK